MKRELNIYCDESCHLENDKQPIMALGAIWCPRDFVRQAHEAMRSMREKYGFSSIFEIKWTKVSPKKIDFYLNLIDWFFDSDELHFRGLIAKDKSSLRHEDYMQDHDTWYFKMYFYLLNVLLDPHSRYKIFLDIKDTCSSEKIRELKNVLGNSKLDFSREIIEDIQAVHSKEIGLMQLADLLIGAISYINRDLKTSEAKLTLVDKIKYRSGYSLTAKTLFKEDKFNLFVWSPRERDVCD